MLERRGDGGVCRKKGCWCRLLMHGLDHQIRDPSHPHTYTQHPHMHRQEEKPLDLGRKGKNRKKIPGPFFASSPVIGPMFGVASLHMGLAEKQPITSHHSPREKKCPLRFLILSSLPYFLPLLLVVCPSSSSLKCPKCMQVKVESMLCECCLFVAPRHQPTQLPITHAPQHHCAMTSPPLLCRARRENEAHYAAPTPSHHHHTASHTHHSLLLPLPSLLTTDHP